MCADEEGWWEDDYYAWLINEHDAPYIAADEDRYRTEQLVKRIGHKRVLELLSDADDSVYYVAGAASPLLRIINTDSLLASVLCVLWREARALSLVCKRFYAAVKRAEFWMPEVRRRLMELLPGPHYAVLRSFIHPFYRFPVALWLAPRPPWYALLCWLFRSRLFSTPPSERAIQMVSIEGPDHFLMRFTHVPEERCVRISCSSHHTGTLSVDTQALVVTQVIAFEGSRHPSHYNVSLAGRLIWYWGPLTGGRTWCGAVDSGSSSSSNSATAANSSGLISFVPINGAGHYVA